MENGIRSGTAGPCQSVRTSPILATGARSDRAGVSAVDAAAVAAELQAHLNQTKSDGATAVEYLDSLLKEKAELTKQKEDSEHAKITAEQTHATAKKV